LGEGAGIAAAGVVDSLVLIRTVVVARAPAFAPVVALAVGA
jgi:hypothetical protein